MVIDIGTCLAKPCDGKDYALLADWCNRTQRGRIYDKGEFFQIGPIEQDEFDSLLLERSALKAKLSELSYVTALIVSGETTPDAFESELKDIKSIALRLKEIETIINTKEL